MDDGRQPGDADDAAGADGAFEERIEAPTSRRISITAAGPSWALRWSAIADGISGLGLTAGPPC